MCRLIMALGKFSVKTLLDAAIEMSEGRTAKHDGPIKQHLNGWGAIWRDDAALHEVSTYHSITPIGVDANRKCLETLNTSFMAIHVRHATISEQIGLDFAHPVCKNLSQKPWYMMHNGFLPTVYEKLKMDSSRFDTAEYLEYIMPKSGELLKEHEVIVKLNALKVGGSSANAIIVADNKVYVVHWTSKKISFMNYFTMKSVFEKDAFYLASEIQPSIAHEKKWQPLADSRIYEFKMAEELNSFMFNQLFRSAYA